jgi:hypothetical protein
MTREQRPDSRVADARISAIPDGVSAWRTDIQKFDSAGDLAEGWALTEDGAGVCWQRTAGTMSLAALLAVFRFLWRVTPRLPRHDWSSEEDTTLDETPHLSWSINRTCEASPGIERHVALVAEAFWSIDISWEFPDEVGYFMADDVEEAHWLVEHVLSCADALQLAAGHGAEE